MSRDLTLTGRAWVFGDDINTDDMYPGFAMRLPLAEAAQFVFNASRPGWPKLVEPGDVIVGGRRFGLGSARPVGALLNELGVACIVAEQFTSLFLRNSINLGLPVLAVPGVTESVREGDVIEVDLEHAVVRNTATGASNTGTPYPPLLLDLIRNGGIEATLRSRGLYD